MGAKAKKKIKGKAKAKAASVKKAKAPAKRKPAAKAKPPAKVKVKGSAKSKPVGKPSPKPPVEQVATANSDRYVIIMAGGRGERRRSAAGRPGMGSDGRTQHATCTRKKPSGIARGQSHRQCIFQNLGRAGGRGGRLEVAQGGKTGRGGSRRGIVQGFAGISWRIALKTASSRSSRYRGAGRLSVVT